MAYPDPAVDIHYAYDLDGTNVDSSLTDFPVCLDLATLPTAVRTWIYDNIDASGNGLRLTTSGGTTINYERKNFAKVGGSPNVVTGQLYYKVPTVNSGSATSLKLFANNGAADGEAATSVWDSNFVGVYHNEANGNDSTSNGYNLTNTGTVSYGTGYLGNAGDFDGTNDYLERTGVPFTAHPVTLEALFKADNVTGAFRIVEVGGANGGGGIEGWNLVIVNGELWALTGDVSGNSQAQVAGLSTGTWYYGTGQFSSATSRVGRINYSTTASNTTSRTPNTTEVTSTTIGAIVENHGQKFDGLIDEVRISNVARSDAWLKFTYHNLTQSDNEHQNFSLVTPGGGHPAMRRWGNVPHIGGNKRFAQIGAW
jgi:hypothetical protein